MDSNGRVPIAILDLTLEAISSAKKIEQVEFDDCSGWILDVPSFFGGMGTTTVRWCQTAKIPIFRMFQ